MLSSVVRDCRVEKVLGGMNNTSNGAPVGYATDIVSMYTDDVGL